MTAGSQPWRVGAFVVGGLALLVVAIAAVLGGQVFTRHDRVVMHFGGSVYGLQIGAPVVFRGVRIGSVASIGLAHDAASGRVAIPVVAELDRGAVHDLQGGTGGSPALPLATLVQRGLVARLSTQSLLTGLLYVDLDLRPELARGVPAASRPAVVGAPQEIPTLPTAFQALQAQLEGIDLGALARDVAAVAAATRQFVAGPQLRQGLDDLGRLTAELRQLTARLDRQVDPLARSAQRALDDTGRAAARIGGAADQLGAAAQRIDALAAPGAPLATGLGAIQNAADELARTAVALRAATGEDAALVQHIDRAAQDVQRAARAVRELAEQLERQPESLIRGRPAAP